jgi:hypothetical protein
MKPIISIDYWLLAIICTFGNCAFCEYIISDISVSHFKAEIKSKAKKKQLYSMLSAVTLDVLKGHKLQ